MGSARTRRSTRSRRRTRSTVTELPPPPAECYSDRATFLAACANVTDSEDFSGFLVDTPFDAGPLAIGTGMTIEAFNAVGFRNFVETPPFQFGDNNGTNHASCYTNQDEPVEIVIDFGATAGGFGFAQSAPETSESAPRYWSPGMARARQRGARRDSFIEVTAQVIEGSGGEGFHAGARVFHQKFGYGEVAKVEGDRLDIAFDKAGRKKVIASFVVPAEQAD